MLVLKPDANRKKRSDKNFLWASGSVCSSHLSFHVLCCLKSSWSQGSMRAPQLAERSQEQDLYAALRGMFSLHFALLSPSCTCAESGGNRTMMKMMITSITAQWWRKVLKNKRYQNQLQREPESHFSVGRTQGITPNYTIQLLCNLEISFLYHISVRKRSLDPRCLQAIDNNEKVFNKLDVSYPV